MNNDNYQATLEAGLRGYMRGLLVFCLMAVPIAFLTGSTLVSTAIGALICLGAIGLALFDWAVRS
jgi:hypothetical protein